MSGSHDRDAPVECEAVVLRIGELFGEFGINLVNGNPRQVSEWELRVKTDDKNHRYSRILSAEAAAIRAADEAEDDWQGREAAAGGWNDDEAEGSVGLMVFYRAAFSFAERVSKVIKVRSGQQYFVQVRCRCADSDEWGKWSAEARTMSHHAVVTSISEIGENYVRIGWDRPPRDTTRLAPERIPESSTMVSSIEQYQLRILREEDMFEEHVEPLTGGMRSYTHHGLCPGTPYVIFARYRTMIGTMKPWVEQGRFYTQAAVEMSLTSCGEDAFSVSWARGKLPENLVGYTTRPATVHLYELAIEGEGITERSVQLPASEHRYRVTGVCPNSEYTISLRSQSKEARWGVCAAPLRIRTAGCPIVSVAAMGETFLSVLWTRKPFVQSDTEVASTDASSELPLAPNDSKVEYHVRSLTSDYSKRLVVDVGSMPEDKVCHIVGLCSGTQYAVSIRCFLYNEWGLWTDALVCRTMAKTSLTFLERGEDFLTVDWTSEPVRCCFPEGFPGSHKATILLQHRKYNLVVTRVLVDGTRVVVLDTETFYNPDAPGFRIENLLSESTYEAQCRAWQLNVLDGSEHWGEFSDPIRARTLEKVVVSIHDLGEDFVQLVWRRGLSQRGQFTARPTGAETPWSDLKYEIVVGCIDTGEDRIIHRQVLENMCTITNLQPATRYVISVRACDEREQWGVWVTRRARTLAPVTTAVHEIGEDYVRLVWQRDSISASCSTDVAECGSGTDACDEGDEEGMVAIGNAGVSQYGIFVYSTEHSEDPEPSAEADYSEGGNAEIALLNTVAGMHTSCRIGELRPDCEYVAVVRAATTTGKWGLWSKPLRLRTNPQFNVPVNNLAIGENYVNLVWSREEHPKVGKGVHLGDMTVRMQQVRIRGVDTPYAKDHDLPSDLRELKVYGLSPMTAYAIQIRTCGRSGDWGLWSPPVHILTRGTILTKAVEVAEDYAIITWERRKQRNPKNYPTGMGLVTAYHLRVYNSEGLHIDTFLGDGDCPYRIAGLRPDTYYCVELKANYNGEEWGLWSTPLWCLTMKPMDVYTQLISEEFCRVMISRPAQRKRLPGDDGNRCTTERVLAFGEVRTDVMLCVTAPQLAPSPFGAGQSVDRRADVSPSQAGVKSSAAAPDSPRLRSQGSSLPADCAGHRLVYQTELSFSAAEAEHTVPNLKSNRVYCVSVRSRLPSGEWGMWSSPSKRFATVPATQVTFTDIGEDYITVEWMRGTQSVPAELADVGDPIRLGSGVITKSRVKIREIHGSFQQTLDVGNDQMFYFIEKLNPAVTYGVAVQTYNDNFDWGVWSEEAKVRTVPAMAIAIQHISEDALWATWWRRSNYDQIISFDTAMNVNAEVDAYEFSIVGEGNFVFSKELDSNSLFFRGLQPDTIYDFQVRAHLKHIGRWGRWSLRTFRTQPTMRVTFGNIGEHFAVVEWRRHLPVATRTNGLKEIVETGDVISEFRLKVELVGQRTPMVYELGPTISSFRLTQLQPSSEYRVWLCAKGYEGVWGLWNQESRVRTLPKLELGLISVGEDYVVVSWKRMAWQGETIMGDDIKAMVTDGAVSSYQVRVLNSSGEVVQSQTVGHNCKSCSVSHLALDTMYSVQVCAMDTYNEWGLWSDPQYFVTLTAIHLEILKIGEESVELEWCRISELNEIMRRKQEARRERERMIREHRAEAEGEGQVRRVSAARRKRRRDEESRGRRESGGGGVGQVGVRWGLQPTAGSGGAETSGCATMASGQASYYGREEATTAGLRHLSFGTGGSRSDVDASCGTQQDRDVSSMNSDVTEGGSEPRSEGDPSVERSVGDTVDDGVDESSTGDYETDADDRERSDDDDFDLYPDPFESGGMGHSFSGVLGGDDDVFRGDERVTQWQLRVYGSRVFGGQPGSDDYMEFFVDSNVQRKIIESLLPSTTYAVTMRARNTSGEWGQWFPQKTFRTLPLLVTSIDYVGETFLNIGWHRPPFDDGVSVAKLMMFPTLTGIHNYQVMIRPAAEELPFDEVDEPLVDGARAYETSQCSIRLGNLIPGTRYQVVVREQVVDTPSDGSGYDGSHMLAMTAESRTELLTEEEKTSCTTEAGKRAAAPKLNILPPPWREAVDPMSPRNTKVSFGCWSSAHLAETLGVLVVDPQEIGENYCFLGWRRSKRKDEDVELPISMSAARTTMYELKVVRMDDAAENEYVGPRALNTTLSFGAEVTSYLLSNLVPNTIYSVSGRAQTEGGHWGVWSTPTNLITQNRLQVRIELINEVSVVVSWTRPQPPWVMTARENNANRRGRGARRVGNGDSHQPLAVQKELQAPLDAAHHLSHTLTPVAGEDDIGDMDARCGKKKPLRVGEPGEARTRRLEKSGTEGTAVTPALLSVVAGEVAVEAYEVVAEGVTVNFESTLLLDNKHTMAVIKGLTANSIFCIHVRSRSTKQQWSLRSAKVSVLTLTPMRLHIPHYAETTAQVEWRREAQNVAKFAAKLDSCRAEQLRLCEQRERQELFELKKRLQDQVEPSNDAVDFLMDQEARKEHYLAIKEECTQPFELANVNIGENVNTGFELLVYGDATSAPFIAGSDHLLPLPRQRRQHPLRGVRGASSRMAGLDGNGNVDAAPPLAPPVSSAPLSLLDWMIMLSGSSGNCNSVTELTYPLPSDCNPSAEIVDTTAATAVRGERASAMWNGRGSLGSSEPNDNGDLSAAAEKSTTLLPATAASELLLMDTYIAPGVSSVMVRGLCGRRSYHFAVRSRNRLNEWGPWSQVSGLTMLPAVELGQSRFGEHYINLYWHRVSEAQLAAQRQEERALAEFSNEFRDLSSKELERLKETTDPTEYQQLIARLMQWQQLRRNVAQRKKDLSDGKGEVVTAANTPVQGYAVRLVHENGSTSESYVKDAGLGSRAFTMTGLEPNQLYVALLCPDYGHGMWGAWTKPLRFVTQNLIQMQVSYIGESFVDIEWKRAPNKNLLPEDEELALTNPTVSGKGHVYELRISYQHPVTGEQVEESRSMRDRNVFRVDSLLPDTKYVLALREWDDKGEWGLWCAPKTCVTLPEMVTRVDHLAETSVTVSWSRVPRKENYDDDMSVLQCGVETTAYYLKVEELADNDDGDPACGSGEADVGRVASSSPRSAAAVDGSTVAMEDVDGLLNDLDTRDIHGAHADSGSLLPSEQPQVQKSAKGERFVLIKRFTADVSSFVVDNLEPNRFYNVQVLSETAREHLGAWSACRYFLTVRKIEMSVREIDEMLIDVQWERQPPRTHSQLTKVTVDTGNFTTKSYQLEVFLYPKEATERVRILERQFDAGVTKYMLDGLELNQLYGIRARSTDDEGTPSEWSDMLNMATLSPIVVQPLHITESTIHVGWHRVAQDRESFFRNSGDCSVTPESIRLGKTSMEVQQLRVFAMGDVTSPIFDRVLTGPIDKIEVGSLKPNQPYIVQARAQNERGQWGLWSEERCVYTMKLIRVDILSAGEDYIRLRWGRTEPDERACTLTTGAGETVQLQGQDDQTSAPHRDSVPAKSYPLLDHPGSQVSRAVYVSASTSIVRYAISIIRSGGVEGQEFYIDNVDDVSCFVVLDLHPDTRYSITVRADYGTEWGMWSTIVNSGTRPAMTLDARSVGEDYVAWGWQWPQNSYPMQGILSGKVEETLCYEIEMREAVSARVPDGEGESVEQIEGGAIVRGTFVQVKHRSCTESGLQSSHRYFARVRRWYKPIDGWISRAGNARSMVNTVPSSDLDEAVSTVVPFGAADEQIRELISQSRGLPGAWSSGVVVSTLRDMVCVVEGITEDSVTVRWEREASGQAVPTAAKPPRPPQSFQLRIDQMTADGTAIDNAAGSLHLDKVFGAEDCSFRVAPLRPDTVYRADVRACVDKVWGEWSRKVHLVTLPRLKISLNYIGEDYAAITWQRCVRPLALPDGAYAVIGGDTGIEKYHLDVSGLDTNYRLEKKLKANRLSYRVRALEANSLYSVSVRSFDVATNSWSFWSDRTVFATLKPLRVRVGLIGEHFAHVEWFREPQRVEEFSNRDLGLLSEGAVPYVVGPPAASAPSQGDEVQIAAALGAPRASTADMSGGEVAEATTTSGDAVAQASGRAVSVQLGDTNSLAFHLCVFPTENTPTPAVVDKQFGGEVSRCRVNLLAPDTSYVVVVRASDRESQWGLWSEEVAIKTLRQMQLRVASVGGRYVTLKWDRLDGSQADGFHKGHAHYREPQLFKLVVRDDESAMVERLVAASDIELSGSQKEQALYTIRDLRSSTSYMIALQPCYEEDDWGMWTKSISVKTLPPPSLSIGRVTADRAEIVWDGCSSLVLPGLAAAGDEAEMLLEKQSKVVQFHFVLHKYNEHVPHPCNSTDSLLAEDSPSDLPLLSQRPSASGSGAERPEVFSQAAGDFPEGTQQTGTRSSTSEGAPSGVGIVGPLGGIDPTPSSLTSSPAQLSLPLWGSGSGAPDASGLPDALTEHLTPSEAADGGSGTHGNSVHSGDQQIDVPPAPSTPDHENTGSLSQRDGGGAGDSREGLPALVPKPSAGSSLSQTPPGDGGDRHMDAATESPSGPFGFGEKRSDSVLHLEHVFGSKQSRCTITQLEQNTTYRVQLRTLDDRGEFGSWSEIVFDTAPPPPGGVTVTKVNAQNALVQWDPPDSQFEYQYVVEQAIAREDGQKTSVSPTAGAGRPNVAGAALALRDMLDWRVVSTLTENACPVRLPTRINRMRFRVKCARLDRPKHVYSVYTEPVSVSSGRPPNSVAGMTLSVLSRNTATIDWVRPMEEPPVPLHTTKAPAQAQHIVYKIFLASLGNPPLLVATTKSTSYTLKELEPSTEYHVYIVVENSFGASVRNPVLRFVTKNELDRTISRHESSQPPLGVVEDPQLVERVAHKKLLPEIIATSRGFDRPTSSFGGVVVDHSSTAFVDGEDDVSPTPPLEVPRMSTFTPRHLSLVASSQSRSRSLIPHPPAPGSRRGGKKASPGAAIRSGGSSDARGHRSRGRKKKSRARSSTKGSGRSEKRGTADGTPARTASRHRSSFDRLPSVTQKTGSISYAGDA